MRCAGTGGIFDRSHASCVQGFVLSLFSAIHHIEWHIANVEVYLQFLPESCMHVVMEVFV